MESNVRELWRSKQLMWNMCNEPILQDWDGQTSEKLLVTPMTTHNDQAAISHTHSHTHTANSSQRVASYTITFTAQLRSQGAQVSPPRYQPVYISTVQLMTRMYTHTYIVSPWQRWVKRNWFKVKTPVTSKFHMALWENTSGKWWKDEIKNKYPTSGFVISENRLVLRTEWLQPVLISGMCSL